MLANVPEFRPEAAVISPKVSPANAGVLGTTVRFSATVPKDPALPDTAPLTLIWSLSNTPVVGFNPPKSIFSADPAASCMSPVTDSVPMAAAPPGLMTPTLRKALTPVPTLMAPPPDKVPALAKPFWAVIDRFEAFSAPVLLMITLGA